MHWLSRIRRTPKPATVRRLLIFFLVAELIAAGALAIEIGTAPIEGASNPGGLGGQVAKTLANVSPFAQPPPSLNGPNTAGNAPSSSLPPENQVVVPTVASPSSTPFATSVPSGDPPGATGGVTPTPADPPANAAANAKIPVYSSFDFLTSYLENLNYPILVQGTPWANGSTNVAQYQQPEGGTSYWDFWVGSEPWDSPNHMWRDDQGNWHKYTTEKVKDSTGNTATGYVLVDRDGPGVMDKLWFTQGATRSFLGVLTQVTSWFATTDPPEVTDWGNLGRLGNLRIIVDGQIVYDGKIEDWFSGDAQGLPSALKAALVWHYGQFGADGNIIPIPYQKHIKILVYGGSDKPMWFMATGLTFAADARVKPYTSASDLPLDTMNQLAQNVLHPEGYIDTLPKTQTYSLNIQSGMPSILQVQGAGTIAALQFRISKQFDPSQLHLKVEYGGEVGIDVPLLAFFSEPDNLSLHNSTPVGVIESGNDNLFYSNFPMPYQNGMRIELTTAGGQTMPVQVRLATLPNIFGTQLRVSYTPSQQLQVFGSDFTVDVDGNGKMVGLVLFTKDQQYGQVPHFRKKGSSQDEADKTVWPMGYLEGNLTMTDGNGGFRLYSGQEDWAEGGYYFNSGYTTPPGGSNRPFAGILRYQGGKDGYATLFRYFNDLSAFPFKDGLHLSFGHGTYRNNFPVTYGATVFYYHQVEGVQAVTLPASEYISPPSAQSNGAGQ